ncbi:hypothetical protein Sjap_000610 [Stephania japonica]|uniref:Uncharacterized protein n=1 Tax=Stephania japonica TaxID=461633 RepID=A0AAP0PSL4_9MAGN
MRGLWVEGEELIVVVDFMKSTIADQSVVIPITYAHGICEQVKLGPKISKTLKRKLRLGARIVQGGGVRESFRGACSTLGGREAFEGLTVPFIHHLLSNCGVALHLH